jgi:SAM-dependent methyltransferase
MNRVLDLARNHPRPTLQLVRARRGLRTWPTITTAIDDPDTLARFAADGPLPVGYGVGMAERVIEYPWLFSRRPAGTILDAGSCLNHKRILARLLPHATSIHIVTLAPERHSFPDLGVSYVYADLRDLPYRDATFDVVACISTLEHVGMDNSRYGGSAEDAQDHRAASARALAELLRVTRPGGRVFVTVPYGRPDDLGWMRVFDRDDVESITSVALEHGPLAAEPCVTVFRYDARGWKLSNFDDALGAVYRQTTTDPYPADLAVTARSVACVELRLQAAKPCGGPRESS